MHIQQRYLSFSMWQIYVLQSSEVFKGFFFFQQFLALFAYNLRGDSKQPPSYRNSQMTPEVCSGGAAAGYCGRAISDMNDSCQQIIKILRCIIMQFLWMSKQLEHNPLAIPLPIYRLELRSIVVETEQLLKIRDGQMSFCWTREKKFNLEKKCMKVHVSPVQDFTFVNYCQIYYIMLHYPMYRRIFEVKKNLQINLRNSKLNLRLSNWDWNLKVQILSVLFCVIVGLLSNRVKDLSFLSEQTEKYGGNKFRPTATKVTIYLLIGNSRNMEFKILSRHSRIKS
ncbi:hypothetical protein WN51_12443 [Melipona quadrifasciata]|uniref:Uncharacterized protein n=1 Tax=Melipona quadrifasciata TaxID=166423 RepID=A0A0M9A4X3_9HYME|nr:hypothetical protein WN51_12443 [Melipona quadrifasciata]